MRSLLFIVGLTSAALLAGAFFGQYALNWYPCELCIYQRLPHLAVVILAGAGLLWAKRVNAQRLILFLCLLMLGTTGSIALYHAGVEADIFEGPTSCSAAPEAGQTLEDLRAEIAGAALVSCKQAMAYVFGISLAVWNAIISFGLIIVTFILLKLRRNPATLP